MGLALGRPNAFECDLVDRLAIDQQFHALVDLVPNGDAD